MFNIEWGKWTKNALKATVALGIGALGTGALAATSQTAASLSGVLSQGMEWGALGTLALGTVDALKSVFRGKVIKS